MRAAEAIKELRNKANKSQAALAQRFFKTSKGEYGYGDIFIGVRVPAVRQIARKYQLLSLTEIEKLTSSKLHEVRLCGLVIITMQYKRAKGEKEQGIWQRRSAILFTFAYIRNRELKPTITIVKMLINDKHDLIQKASGWALREVGKKNVSLLRGFLRDNATKMGRTSLRYAIERLPKVERKAWLAK